MEVIIGKNAGFCYGVKRAVDGAKQECEKEKNIYCLGDIVHNQHVIDDLKEKGITFIENIDEAKGTTIIRAHGVSKDIYEKAKNKNIELIDLTCPSVLKIHKIAQEYSEKGYYILLTGKEKHPEIIGIESHCGNKYKIIKDKEYLLNVIEEVKDEENILLISQTTFNSKKFDEIAEILKSKINSNLEIKKTICPSTEIKQKETEEIAKNVDVMIIIGDKKSSNTTKLFEISKKYCEKVIFLEDSNELSRESIKDAKKIGIMAGASTPIEQIEIVKGRLL